MGKDKIPKQKLRKIDIAKILKTIYIILQSKIIDGVIWATSHINKENFPKHIKIGKNYVKLNQILNDNVIVQIWVPQVPILNHKSVKLFFKKKKKKRFIFIYFNNKLFYTTLLFYRFYKVN